MHSEFRYHSENLAMIVKFRYHRESDALRKFEFSLCTVAFAMIANFCYDSEFSLS